MAQLIQQVESFHCVALSSRALEEQGNYVALSFLSKLQQLRDSLPLVAALRSPELSTQHWAAINGVLGFSLNISKKTFTLRSFLELNLDDNKGVIAAIVLRAHREQ